MTASPLRPPLRTWPVDLDARAEADIRRPVKHQPVSQNTKRAERVHRQLRADVLKADEAEMKLRSLLTTASAIRQPWNRQCFLCGALAMCEHRESELVEVWQR